MTSAAERKAALLDRLPYDPDFTGGGATSLSDSVPGGRTSGTVVEKEPTPPAAPGERRELPGIHPPAESVLGPAQIDKPDPVVPWVPEIPPEDAMEGVPAAGSDGPSEKDIDAATVTGATSSRVDVVPLTDQRLLHIFDTKVETPAGRAYFREGDRIIASSLKVVPEPGHFTADLHGSPTGFVVDKEVLDAADLAQVIRADPGWEGQPVRLISCETGKGENPVAQRLADELDVPVKAPTELAWVNTKTGEVYSSTKSDDMGIVVPTTPYDGDWITFQPGKEAR